MTDLILNWQQIATFWVPATPVAQPRPRARAMQRYSPKLKRKVWVGTVYNPDDADDWKRAVVLAGRSCQPAEKILGPVSLDVIAHLPRPKYLNAAKYPAGPVPHLAVPDIDNIWKGCADCMTRAGWWRDDSQVCAGETIKVYHRRGGQPGARITVSVLADQEAGLFDAPAA